MLQINKLTKRFGDKTAVSSADIFIDKPAMIGVIGRSGAGKSTLLRMLNRLSDSTTDKIEFEGDDITALRGSAKRDWQSRCAMIFQQFNLVPRMDVVSNVLHGTLNKRSTFATMFNLYPQSDIHRAIEILDRLGIAEQAPKRAEALSGG
jgi:phosphonate transport system ATP-binding protein